MASRSQILGVLTKARLLNIAWKFDVTGLSALRKADIVNTLARKLSIPMEEVLDSLKRDELKAICQRLGLDDSGKKKSPLIERIIKASGRRKPKKSYPDEFHAGGLTFEYDEEAGAWYAEYEDDEFGIYLMNGPDTENDWASPEQTSNKPEWNGEFYSLEDFTDDPGLMQRVGEDLRQHPFFAKAEPLEEIESVDTSKGETDLETLEFENDSDKDYVEMTPDLVLRKTTTPAIQVFIDHLPDTEPQDWQPTVRKFTKEWIESNDFEKEGTIWFWGTNAVYQGADIVQPAWAEFAVPFGFGSGFFDFLLRSLKRLWGSAVKISSYVVVNISEGWSVLCHAKDGKVWQQIDPITWIEFTS